MVKKKRVLSEYRVKSRVLIISFEQLLRLTLSACADTTLVTTFYIQVSFFHAIEWFKKTKKILLMAE